MGSNNHQAQSTPALAPTCFTLMLSCFTYKSCLLRVRRKHMRQQQGSCLAADVGFYACRAGILSRIFEC